MSRIKQANLMGSIENLLAQVEAAEKKAEANTEAGGYQGSTTHPVKDVDDRTSDARTGSRYSENTSDVKADQGKPGVESTEAGPTGGQDSVQVNIGVSNAATGEDPSTEDDYKGGKDDPGTTHEARTDNDSLDGHKYAQFRELRRLSKQAEEAGNAFLAAIAVEAEGDVQKKAEQLQKSSGNTSADAKNAEKSAENADDDSNTEEEPSNKAASAESKKAAAAGYDLAGLFADLDIPLEDKAAADQAVVSMLAQVLETADRRAEKCAQFYAGMANSKAAEGEEYVEETEENPPEGGGDESADAAAEAGLGADAGGMPPEGGGGDEEALMALLSGGEDMGGESAMAGMAGADGGGAMSGGGEMAGGMPPDAMAGGGGAPGAGGEDNIAMLMQVLEQLGITPEELQTQLAGKVASSLRAEKAASKKNKPKSAEEAQRLRAMAAVVQEIVGRGA